MSICKIDNSAVALNSGKTEMIVGGKKIAPIWYTLTDIPEGRKPWVEWAQTAIHNFGKAGIDVVSVSAYLYEAWQENGDCDISIFLKEVEAIVKANPNARIIPRLNLNAPYWWLRKYPQEQIKYYTKKEIDGVMQYVEVQNTDSGDYDPYVFGMPYEEMKASYASKQWLNDTSKALEKFCKAVKAHPLGDYVIGIQVAYGTCGEWHYFGNVYDGKMVPDFSAPMQEFFREVVKEQYGTLEELKKYYGKDATFENVEMATAEERESYFKMDEHERGDFLLQETHARVIDSMRTYSLSAANAISHFCQCVKEASDGEWLAGAFYGYSIWSLGAKGAHGEIVRLLQDKNIDFFASPSGYDFNKESGNVNVNRQILESTRLYGKICICEMDQGYASVNMRTKGHYVCESEEEYAAIMKRNVLELVLHGHGTWYFDHTDFMNGLKEGSYWNKKERMDAITDIQRACEKIVEKPFKKTTDVLIVFDVESKYYISYDAFKFPLLDAIGKSGAGVDFVYLQDLKRCDLSRYQCVVFNHCRVMTSEIYEYIKNTVMSDNRTVLIMDEFATVVDKVGSYARLSEIVKTELANGYHEYEMENCKICHSKELITDKAFYRDLFAKAGCHIYTENGEVVIADNELVMVHCRDLPKTKLHLHCGDIEIENEKFSTVVYNTITGEKIL